MKKIPDRLLLICALTLFVAGCGADTTTQKGGTEAGNPPPADRVVKGIVPKNSSTGNCNATKVVLTNSKDQASSNSVNSDCSFSVSVSSGDASTITLFKKDTFTALMAFSHSAAIFQTNTLVVGSGTRTIDFGKINVSGTTGTAATEPSTQNDQDGDGIVDFDDEDDDNNGVKDVNERDCDLDGYLDTVDQDETTCTAPGDIGSVPLQAGEDWVMEILPRSKAKYVPVDQPVKVRTNCAIDPTSVKSSTFDVVDTQGNHVTCTASLSSSDKVLTCTHADLTAGMDYTATVEGLHCADDRGTIRTVTWHFTTAVPAN